jgi:hypothetical protein
MLGFPWRPALVLPLLLLTGCGDGRRTVEGTVTFDGQPLAKGTILFVKTDGELVREGGVITDGAFHCVLPDGNYKIEINAQRVSGKITAEFMGKMEELDKTEEMIPERYNAATELTAQIKPGMDHLKLILVSK